MGSLRRALGSPVLTRRLVRTFLLVVVPALIPSAGYAPVQPITALAPFETLVDGQVELVGVAVLDDGAIYTSDGAVYISAHRLFAADGLDTEEGREILRLGADGSLAVVATGIRRLEGLALHNGSLIASTKGLESGPDSAGTLLRYPILADGGLGTPVLRELLGCRAPLNPPSAIDRPIHHFFDVQRGGGGLAWLREDSEVVVWTLTRVELFSALPRRRRARDRGGERSARGPRGTPRCVGALGRDYRC